MRSFLALIFATTALAQTGFVAQKTTALSGAAEVVTIQQIGTGARTVEFQAAYIDCSVACTLTLERNGAFAGGTALTPLPINPRDGTAVTQAFYSSTSTGGSVLSVYSIPAGGFLVIDLTGIRFEVSNALGSNLTFRTSSITGTVHLTVKFTER